ncbi:hypothetical protein HRI_003770100 [Hibiscus trionum]|uniref:Integrase n=1 Tax=Hibiscus trionum TaxID=183268 RepID=A0A9W7ITH9_HIBTR|nr:hypothetical protein HRI_003770100 [Hibiscus trionum]
MRKYVKNFVRECGVCQRSKEDLSYPRGLLQPLPKPEVIWSSINMDFIEELPLSRKKDVIWVIVDRLTKYAHFIAIAHLFQLKKWLSYSLKMFSNYMACFRILCVIRRELFEKLGTAVTPSTTYHPQTDG